MFVKIECSVNEKLIDQIDFLRRWERQTGSYMRAPPAATESTAIDDSISIATFFIDSSLFRETVNRTANCETPFIDPFLVS